MATATDTKPAAPAQTQIAIAGPRLPYPTIMLDRFGIDRDSWRALTDSIFPNAVTIESIFLACAYCKARNLDVLKRVVHIVPIYSKEKERMVDTVWPGIGELRTTAFRTQEYAGRDKTEYGPDIKAKVGKLELTYPEWAQVTLYRMVRGVRVGFAGPQVYWLETYASKSRQDDTPNDMWATRPRGQIDKCAEAAALRAAFPEEVGSDYIPDEVAHNRRGTTLTDKQKPIGLDDVTKRLEAEAGRAPSDPTTIDEPPSTVKETQPEHIDPAVTLKRLAIELGCPEDQVAEHVETALGEERPSDVIRTRPWAKPSAFRADFEAALDGTESVFDAERMRDDAHGHATTDEDRQWIKATAEKRIAAIRAKRK